MQPRSFVTFVRELYDQWQSDNALSHGAALAYYALFSMAPLLMLVIAIVGLVLGDAAARGQLVGKIENIIGADAARTVEGLIVNASVGRSGFLASAVSLITMLVGASGVFGQLRASLNQIWNVRAAASGGMAAAARQRLASFAVIVGIGGLLLASLLLTAALAAIHDVLARHLPVLTELLPAMNFLLSFLLTTSLFAMIYKLLPDVRMDWRDVWLGAAVTALLFTIGKTLIGLYLGRTGVASVYGAAGSLVLLLLWVYYCAQIFLVGAEFTEVYSRLFGSRREQADSPE